MAIKKLMKLLILLNANAKDCCDISYYQGNVDFETMKRAGIKAVIIRAGYGTTTDKRFVSYINAAVKAGIAVGVYWFIYAKDITGAKNNAKKCLEVIAPYRDYITCGIWCDWEYDSDRYAGALTSKTRSDIVDAFNTEIESAGYEVGIYSNQDYIRSEKFIPEIIKRYPLWFAKYSSGRGIYADKGKYGSPYLWQYSSLGNGAAYGASSKYIDLNKIYIALDPEASVSPADKVSVDPDIIKASDNPYPEPTRNIYYRSGKSSMYGDDVKWVQWHLWRFGLFLNKKGIPDAKQIDGIWGVESGKALEIAQARLGLKQDGICGILSREKFKSV